MTRYLRNVLRFLGCKAQNLIFIDELKEKKQTNRDQIFHYYWWYFFVCCFVLFLLLF